MERAITFSQFKYSFDQYKIVVEKILTDQVTFLWFDDYYDGMLSGILEYENQRFRFEIITDYEKQIRPREFAIIHLSERQIEEEIYWHSLFEKYVCDDLGYKPSSEHYLFYDEYQKRNSLNYDLSYVKGWYVEQ